MPILGHLIKSGIRIGTSRPGHWEAILARQRKVLVRLLTEAKDTAFGRHYGFGNILNQPDPVKAFRRRVPVHGYDKIYDEWWSRARMDEPDVCWPGLVPWFALSSGTSNAASKYIPVTPAIIKSMKKVSRRLFCDMAHFDLPASLFTKQMLMVGGCTQLIAEGDHWVGDMSGIIGLNRPYWLKNYYRPGREITAIPEWEDRIVRIAEEAPNWDIGFIVGNVAWVQLIFEKIIEKYGLKHIHEIWPNFSLLVHGGIFFEPYRTTFEQLIGKRVEYVDSYMASEGFIAYQPGPETRLLRLIIDAGIYYEFIPFDGQHFDEDGNPLPHAKTHTLETIRAGQDYAILLSTDAGTWRYLLGDTVRFENVKALTFKVTGRVKHYLSVVGEHLSIDNMNRAIRMTDRKMQAGIKEFAAAAIPSGSHWSHQWYVSADNCSLSETAFAASLDEELMKINDDYRVERRYALKEVKVKLLSHDVFYNWLKEQGKLNGQAKIPRVMKGAILENWQSYLNQNL